MSLMSRVTPAIFTALPSLLFFFWFLTSGSTRHDYFWNTYLIVMSILLICSVIFGLALPSLFGLIRLRQPWIWILAAGISAVLLAFTILTALNATPLCVGQDNGDGNNDFGMCMGYVILDAVIFLPIFLFLQTICAITGHWIVKWIQSIFPV